MISVVILGTGNVAQNLFEAMFPNKQINIVGVIGRNNTSLVFFKDRTTVSTNWTDLPLADIYIMAIKDDAIPLVSDKLNVNGLLVHTSGSVPLTALSKHHDIGVFYPLQTFTSGKKVDFKKIPICLEAQQEDSLKLLQKLAGHISNTVETIDSEKRKALHVAAVFANNFTNHLYHIANDICNEHQIDFTILKPLINETANKLNVLSPKEAQTGPARRGDQKTLHNHLRLLKVGQHREIYKLMSNSIKATYGEEL
ncbi:Rossmann-like and DUF2520 domain-containing protein [Maribacter thermophilus]|uniref:Rossmann-like and DUF2520 domain-containing protein n=1 Tax=Maribacter thermophilus TaxID=1197874 RepID=UPI00064111AA|nr:DUF2520 domain-containing protein [Maribacter thermophilus]